MSLSEFAPAKVNLFLHVGPLAADGYHPISSLMMFADLGDRVSIAPAEHRELAVGGPFAAQVGPDEDNLVARASAAVFALVAEKPAAFRLLLDKVLPVAAGLGGGSSDAGATLRLLGRAFALPLQDERLLAIAASLGADGAACFRAQTVVAEGRGERLTTMPDLPALDAVLVNPGIPSPTRAVYAAFDAFGPALPIDPPPGLDQVRSAMELVSVLAACRNDLERPAVDLQPEIGHVLATLRDEPETQLARMSGSGATCFALCAGDIEAAGLAERLQSLQPGWWVRSCRLGGD